MNGRGSIKPNFSGEYILDRTSCVLSGGAATIVSAVLRIDHDEPRFRCAAKFVSATDTIEFSFERFTDGRETVSGADERSRCYWNDTALLSEDQMGSGDEAMVMTWRYELISDARRLRAGERILGAGRDQDNVWEFDRQ